jgi:WD40 repeat protein
VPRKFLTFLSFIFAFATPAIAEEPVLVLSTTVPLIGYHGGFDHFAFEPSRGRFFLASEDHGTVDVFDLKSGKHLEILRGFYKPHSIVVRPNGATILVVDSGPSKSQLIDSVTYRKIKNVPLEIGANAALYDAQRNRIYVTTGGDRVNRKISTLIAVDPDTGSVVNSVQLPSIHLQPLTMDPSTNRLFVNLADKGRVAVVDRDSFSVLAQWPTGAARRNSAIAFDSAKRRLYVMGKSGVLAVLNADTGEITNRISVPKDADDIAFDESAHRVYIPGGDGFIGIYDTTNPDQVRELARVVTRREARTGLLIPAEHKYLLAASEVGDKTAEVMIFDVR